MRPHRRHRHRMRLPLCLRHTLRELKQHRRHLIRPRPRLSRHGRANDLRRDALRSGERVVQRLIHPCQCVDPQIEQTTAREIEVHHPMARIECFLGFVTNTRICMDAEDFADAAGGDGVAERDGEGEVTRPDGFHEEEVLRPGRRVEEFGLGGVNGEGFLAEDGLVVGEAEHDVFGSGGSGE
jgi:hypothetical protein